MSVRHALLALLHQRPMHGYELGRQLALAVSPGWQVSPGQIASTLARLKEAGLVDCDAAQGNAAPDRKVYRLTAEGEAELEAWYLAPEMRQYQVADVFYIKLLLSLLGGPVAPERVLMAQRRQLYQELHQVTELRHQADPRRDLPWVLLLDNAATRLEADLRWLEMCEGRLADLKRYQPPAPPPRRRGRPRGRKDAMRKT